MWWLEQEYVVHSINTHSLKIIKSINSFTLIKSIKIMPFHLYGVIPDPKNILTIKSRLQHYPPSFSKLLTSTLFLCCSFDMRCCTWNWEFRAAGLQISIPCWQKCCGVSVQRQIQIQSSRIQLYNMYSFYQWGREYTNWWAWKYPNQVARCCQNQMHTR